MLIFYLPDEDNCVKNWWSTIDMAILMIKRMRSGTRSQWRLASAYVICSDGFQRSAVLLRFGQT